MKKKIRLIARLDVKDANLVKGIQLEGRRKLGDPNGFAREYYQQGIDELLYIDIVASLYNRNNLSDIVRKTVDEVYIPVCVGGGLRSVEDVRHPVHGCGQGGHQHGGHQAAGADHRGGRGLRQPVHGAVHSGQAQPPVARQVGGLL